MLQPLQPLQHPPIASYSLLEKIGEGTYGVVFKARSPSTHQIVALKRIRFDNDDNGVPATALREVALLLDLDHPNIVRLLDAKSAFKQLHLVFEYLDMDLKVLMDRHGNAPLPPTIAQSLSCQLLRALEFCHRHRVLHRDLKPQNVLVDSAFNLKLADFGLARAFNLPMRVYTHEVVTLWYRPPEILLGSKLYSFAVDLWSAGCIVLEMMVGKAVFPGDSEIDQLFKIFQLRGTPHPTVWSGVADLPDFTPEFPQWRPRQLDSLVLDAPQYSLHLVENMLKYDPNERFTARYALTHPYFDGVQIPVRPSVALAFNAEARPPKGSSD
ncbi:cyclin-dependent kinase 2 [Blastocladiella britannica]|nr:cyclin-dependent kinase 2 [Blastocladiella britannica]